MRPKAKLGGDCNDTIADGKTDVFVPRAQMFKVMNSEGVCGNSI